MKLYIEGKNIEKYFDHRTYNEKVILSPKTLEIFQYYQYIKNYGQTHCITEYNHCIKMLDSFEDYEEYKIDIFAFVLEDDVIEFEFPDEDEETAFYFKLKYC